MTETLREAARRLGLESRRAQGVPDHVENPSVLAIAVQFLQDAEAGLGRRPRRPAHRSLEAPTPLTSPNRGPNADRARSPSLGGLGRPQAIPQLGGDDE